MDLSKDLDFLKDELKTFVEEKTFYAGSSALIQEMIQLQIHLTYFLIDCLDCTLDKTKSKRKFEEESQLLEEKKQEEIEKLREGIELYFDRLADQAARANTQKEYQQARDQKIEKEEKTKAEILRKRSEWNEINRKRNEAQLAKMREEALLRRQREQMKREAKAVPRPRARAMSK